MKAVFHPAAHQEMIESARIYEGRSEGFDLDFLTAVEETNAASSNSPKQVQSTERTSGSDWYPAFLLRFFTRHNLIASSSRPSCINIAGPVIGVNAWRLGHHDYIRYWRA